MEKMEHSGGRRVEKREGRNEVEGEKPRVSYDRRYLFKHKGVLREVEWSYLGMEVFLNVFFYFLL